MINFINFFVDQTPSSNAMFKRLKQSLLFPSYFLYIKSSVLNTCYQLLNSASHHKDIEYFHWTAWVLTLAIKNLVKKETLVSICFGANSRHATYKKGRVYSKGICNNMELCMHYALRTKRGKRWKYLWFCSASPCVFIPNVCMQYRAVRTGFVRGAIFNSLPPDFIGMKKITHSKGLSNCPFGVFGSTEKPTKSF